MNNIAFLKGNLGKDPEIRTTQKGIKVATYSLGVCRQNPADKDKPLTDWFNIVAWGDQAESVLANVKKGTKVIVSGRFQTRNYDDKDGKKVYVTELMQDDFGIVPTKAKKEQITEYEREDLPF